jgi:hypothetical protein
LANVVDTDLEPRIRTKETEGKADTTHTKGFLLSIALRILEKGLNFLVIRVFELRAVVLLLCRRPWGRST